MADVFQTIKSSNPVVNGGAVVGVDKLGNYHTIPPKIDESDIVRQSGQLDNPDRRFDDYSYYSA